MRKHYIKRSRELLVFVGALAAAAMGFGADTDATPGDLLEEGVYLQEGKGDLAGAIALYQRIIEIDSANRPRAAEAQYRLAVCYLDEGNAAMAVQAFEALVRDYPNQAEWVEAALAHLPQSFHPNSDVPWPDRERIRFEIRLPNGDAVGNMMVTTSLFEYEGRRMWRVTNRQFVRGYEMLDSADFDAESMQSSGGHYHDSNSGSATYKIEAGQISTFYEKNGKEKTMPFEGSIYGNAQTISLMRQVPPREGYSTEQTIYAPLGGTVLRLVLKVVGIEKMDTIDGEAECYRMEVDVMGQTQSFWFTNDADRKIVKIGMGSIESVAIGYDEIALDERREFTNSAFGYSFQHADDWASFQASGREENSSKRDRVELRSGHSIATISVSARRIETKEGDTRKSPQDWNREAAENQADGYAQEADDFEIDEASEREFEVNGAPALAIGGSLNMAGKPMLLRKTFISSGDRQLVFTLRCPESEAATVLAVFDEMAASARIE